MIELTSKTLHIREDDGIPVLTFPAFGALPFVRHGFSTRLGGVSTGIYTSMNLSFTRGDDPAAVRENFRRFCHALGVDEAAVVISAQTHTTNVRRVTVADCGRGIVREPGHSHRETERHLSAYTDVDGLMTNEPGVVLCTQYADCVPLFFADPVRRVVACSHAGWRGTAANMGRVTVERMAAEFGCQPADILVGIGPSIGRCCFEVDEPVYRIFAGIDYMDDTCMTVDGGGKYHVDLWECNRRGLIAAGVLPEHITVTDLCTRCHPDVFWSHRAVGKQRGSLAAFISLV